ncbi:hypothetical protein [Ramlibacter sp. AN1133]|uniref:hypothetical protein n=1 Tax=Ramlibacter sp. AN1133 TaxID=3133429 RepID=UPI0030BD62CA
MKKSRLASLLALIVGVAGILLGLFASNAEKTFYYYDRWSKGHSVLLGSQCYELPGDWLPTQENATGRDVQVRLHFSAPPVFAMIRQAETVAPLLAKAQKIRSVQTGVDALRFDTPQGERLFIVHNSLLGLAVTGDSEEALERLASAIRPCK